MLSYPKKIFITYKLFVHKLYLVEKNSEYMKEHSFVADQRPWGGYTIFTDNEISSVKILEVKGLVSLQSHAKRSEIWHVISGEVIAYRGKVGKTLEDTKANLEEYHLKAGDNIIIPQGYAHRLKGLGEKPALILEVLKGKYEEGDIVRYEDIYGRK